MQGMGGQVQARKGGLEAVRCKPEMRKAELGVGVEGRGETKGMGRDIRQGRSHWKAFRPKELGGTETREVIGQVL